MFSLCSLRTNSCCCGVPLKTGTVAIIIFSLICDTLILLDTRKQRSYVIAAVIFIIIDIAALYGVYKRKPDFIIPHLVLAVIILVVYLFVIIVSLIFLPFASKFLKEATYVGEDGKQQHLSKTVIDSFYFIYGAMILLLTVYEVLKFHFFKVVISFYRELKAKPLNTHPAVAPPSDNSPPPIGFVA